MALAVAAAAMTGVVLFVDLSPRVQGDFFFSADDPQMAAARAVAETFPAGAQLVLRVADRSGDIEAYRDRIVALTEELLAIEGVDGGYSISTDNPATSPLFGRILLTPDPTATISRPTSTAG